LEISNNTIDYKHLLIFVLICAIFLFPILFFPLSGDLALFLSGVKMLDAGYLPYKDIIDIKSPFLFYVVKAITWIFGSGEQSLRFFDFVAQITTCIMMYMLLYKVYKDKIASFASGVIYSLTYTILNFTNTSQIESFFGLIIIPMIYIQLYKNDKLIYYFTIAILIGLFTGLKYTLGLLIVTPFIDDIFFNKKPTQIIVKKFLIMCLGFIISFGGTLLPYLNPEIRQGMVEMSSYFNFYASHIKLNSAFVSSILNAINFYLSSFISIFVLGLILIAFLNFIKKYDSNSNESKFLRITFIIFVLIFITFLIERKGYSYHHSRVNSTYMIFAGVGFSIFYNFIKHNFDSTAKKLIIVTFLIIMVPLSPLVRWVNVSQLPYKYFFNFPAYAQKYESDSDSKVNTSYITHRKVAEYINNRISPNDKVILAATGSGYINYLLKTDNKSKFTQSSYYVYPKASNKHINDFISEISTSKFTIFQTNDVYPDVNGTSKSTYEAVINNPKIKSAIDKSLVSDTTIGKYIIMHNINYNSK